MSDIDFWGAKVGDVCNHDGDIRGFDGGNPAIIKAGIVLVGQEQVERAQKYGWKVIGTNPEGLIEIRR